MQGPTHPPQHYQHHRVNNSTRGTKGSLPILTAFKTSPVGAVVGTRTVGNLFRLERKTVERTVEKGANASRCVVDQGAIRSGNDSEESVAERRVVESGRGSGLHTLPI